jgi:hypothetical protein
MGTCLCADQDDHSLSALLPRGIQPRRAAQDRNGQIADSGRLIAACVVRVVVRRSALSALGGCRRLQEDHSHANDNFRSADGPEW